MNARETARSTGDDGVGLYVFCFARAAAAGVAVGHGLDAAERQLDEVELDSLDLEIAVR